MNKKFILIAIAILMVTVAYSFYHAPSSPPLEAGVKNASEIAPHNFTEDEVAEIINAIPGEDTF